MKYLFIICVCIMARRVPLISSLPLGEPVAGMSGLNSGQKHFKSVIDKYSDIIDKAYKKKKNNNRKPKRKSKPKNLDLRTMLRKDMLRKEIKTKKRCKGVFLKGNPSVIAVLKKISSLNVKVRDLLPSREDGTCVSKTMTVQSLLKRVPGLKRKLHTLLRSG